MPHTEPQTNAAREAGHTPGPWTAEPPNKTALRDCWTAWPTTPGYAFICAVTQGPLEEANARLIASAPDLLAALQACKTWIENTPRDKGAAHQDTRGATWEQARAAIAKAKGTP